MQTCSVVTGGAGFIGSHLVEKLIDLGHRVIVIDDLSSGRMENLAHIKNEYLHVIEKSILNIDTIELPCDLDYVFHLAGKADIVPSITQPEEYYNTNTTGTFKALQWALANNAKKFVYAASSSCYGIPEKYPTPETAQINPQYPYALTKRLGEELVMHWGQVYKLPVISLRLFNVYGLRSRTSGAYGAVMGVFLAQIANDKPVTVIGDGEQTRDFTHVKDVVDAFIKSAECKHVNEIFNVGTGEPVSINRLAQHLGANLIEYIPDRPGEPRCTRADKSKIIKMLAWTPLISIKEGTWHLAQNIAQYKNAPVWTSDAIREATKAWNKFL